MNDQTIEALLVEKRRLERSLLGSINQNLNEFYNKTGVKVDSVSVHFIRINECGKQRPDVILSKVEAGIKL